MKHFVGIDIGTTNIKAIALDEGGCVTANASESTPTVREGPGRALHHADELWLAACRVLRRVAHQVIPEGPITAVAVASVGEEGFPLDEHGHALYPGILWHDERTRNLESWWKNAIGEERIHQLTGLPIGHTFTALKIQWLYENEPEVMRRAAHWLCVSDYLAYRLSGAMTTTPSLASRTMLYDIFANSWSSELLRAAGIPEYLLPPIVNSGTVIGSVQPDAATVTGLGLHTLVVTGGHDHICGFAAAGATHPGDVIHSGGTAESLARIVGRAELAGLHAVSRELSFGAHVLPDRYYCEKGRYSGAVVRWWERMLSGNESIEALRREAAQSPPGANGLIFLPYMFGKGSPEASPLATGSLLGLTADHDRGDILRAVLEGVCYDTVQLQGLLRQQEGGSVVVIGGLAHNHLWLEIKANILRVEVWVPDQQESVAHGAALLAASAAGSYSDQLDFIDRLPGALTVTKPDPLLSAHYRSLYENHYLPVSRRGKDLVRRPSCR